MFSWPIRTEEAKILGSHWLMQLVVYSTIPERTTLYKLTNDRFHVANLTAAKLRYWIAVRIEGGRIIRII